MNNAKRLRFLSSACNSAPRKVWSYQYYDKSADKKTLNLLSQKYGIRVLYLFGSRATGREKFSSDYDFAVILDEKISSTEYSRYKLNIISELLRLIKIEHIDLIILNSVDVPVLLKYNIIKEGKVIYEKNKSARVDTEVDILRHWLDWQYFEKMWGDINSLRQKNTRDARLNL